MKRLSHKAWPLGKDLCKEDYVIITGDFGLIWDSEPSQTELYWIKWLNDKPWTTLFVDGNHENHKRLNQLPVERKFGGKVGIVGRDIFHLKRGEVYEVGGKKIFTFGGADSVDKVWRITDVSWWKEEIPTYAEMDYALENLGKHGKKVDFIIAHTAPQEMVQILLANMHIANISQDYAKDPTQSFLNELRKTVEFEKYYCGHFHVDCDYDKYCFLWDRIVRAS
jgi:predicted phosphohydrolase